jgi:general stress protein CsbA
MSVRTALHLFIGLLLALLGLAAWSAADTPHDEVLHHLNGIAPDGEVERYTAQFHGRVQENLRRAAALLGILGLALLVRGVRIWRRAPVSTGAISGFAHDLHEVLGRYAKRTSPAHKRAVLLIILAGTLLRVWASFAPITYDEAFTWTYFASRPLHVVLCDYAYPNNHVLHTLLVKWSTTLLGTGLFSLRLPALLAAVLFMPAFYFFVRATFNRYIALMTLALVAASPVLVEYSALARGYGITWLCMAVALLLGRHQLRAGSRVSALLLGLVLALGTWAVPTMVYPGLMVLVWLLVQQMVRYGAATALRRSGGLAGAAVTWGVVTMLLYLPILIVYGPDHLLDHPVLERPEREVFLRTLGDRLVGVHAHLAGTNLRITRLLALAMCVVAGYYSGRYRSLLFAALCGALVLVPVQGHLAPARAWLYLVPFVHLGVGIGLFYMLKLINEKFLPTWGKRQRVQQTSVALMLITAWPLAAGTPRNVERFPEAREAAHYLRSAMDPGDRLYMKFPWEAPIEFHAVAAGMDRGMLHHLQQGGLRFVAVPWETGLEVGDILLHHHADTTGATTAQLVLDLPRLGIFAVR